MIKDYFRILKNPHAYLQAILKAHVKFQKDWPKTVGGVKGTEYLLLIDFCNIRTQKMSKDRTKTVGGVKGTRYLLKIRNQVPHATRHGKPKTVSLCFSSKRWGTIKTWIT